MDKQGARLEELCRDENRCCRSRSCVHASLDCFQRRKRPLPRVWWDVRTLLKTVHCKRTMARGYGPLFFLSLALSGILARRRRALKYARVRRERVKPDVALGRSRSETKDDVVSLCSDNVLCSKLARIFSTSFVFLWFLSVAGSFCQFNRTLRRSL